MPNQQAVDESLSAYDAGAVETWESSMLKDFFYKHPRFRKGLLIVVLLRTGMAISDGVLTPTISTFQTRLCDPNSIRIRARCAPDT